MPKLFNIHKKQKQFGFDLSADWFFGNSGGYTIGYFKKVFGLTVPTMWTFRHTFKMRGDPKLFTEEEFALRFQYDLREELQLDFLTLRLCNPTEGRWFVFYVRLPLSHVFKAAFSFGWCLTKESRENAAKQVAESIVKQREGTKKLFQPKGGSKWPNQKPVFEAR